MSETAKCKCGAEIEGVLDTPPSAGKFWQRVGTCEVCVDNHWHEPAEATLDVPERVATCPNIAFVKEYLAENGQRGYLKQLEQYEAVHMELLVALKSLVCDVSAGNREAAKATVAKAEPQAGAQVPPIVYEGNMAFAQFVGVIEEAAKAIAVPEAPKTEIPAIARWKMMEDSEGDYCMERWRSGDWVKYTDHIAAVAALEGKRA